ncbi:MAG: DNA-binding protein [Microcoleus sp.]
MTKSLPYHPYKISNLKDPNYSAGYLTEIFEEESGDLELGIMRKALRDVFEALGEPNMSAEDAKLHLEKLDALLPQEGIATIYALANWLKVLGLKLTVTVAAENEEPESDSVSDVEEFASVGNA